MKPKTNKKQENAHKKSHVEKNWKRPSTAGGPLLLFLFQSLFPFFNRFFLYFPFTFIAYFGRVRIDANDPAMCKPTHLIAADAINKSTRIPPLTFFVPFHPRYSAFLRLLTKLSSELLPPQSSGAERNSPTFHSS